MSQIKTQVQTCRDSPGGSWQGPRPRVCCCNVLSRSAFGLPDPSEPRNPKLETRDPTPETQNTKPETRNPKQEARNPVAGRTLSSTRDKQRCSKRVGHRSRKTQEGQRRVGRRQAPHTLENASHALRRCALLKACGVQVAKATGLSRREALLLLAASLPGQVSILYEKAFKFKLPGSQVFYSVWSFLVTSKNSCSELHHRKVLITKPGTAAPRYQSPGSGTNLICNHF